MPEAGDGGREKGRDLSRAPPFQVPRETSGEDGAPNHQDAGHHEDESEPHSPDVDAVGTLLPGPPPIDGVGHLGQGRGHHGQNHVEAQGAAEEPIGEDEEEPQDDLHVQAHSESTGQVLHELLIDALGQNPPKGVSKGGQPQKEDGVAEPGMEGVHGPRKL